MVALQKLRLIAASMLACRRRALTTLREIFPLWKRECRIVVQLGMINICSDIDREMTIVCRLPSKNNNGEKVVCIRILSVHSR